MVIPPKLRALLWFLKYRPGTNIHDMSPLEARRSANTISKQVDWIVDYPTIRLFKVEDHLITGRQDKIPIRIYRPSEEEGLPLILFFHGGGFVINDLDSHDKVCRRISRDNRAVVIAVDYRLAPEHPFPAAAYDTYDATLWAYENPEIHTGDPNQLMVMGDSAGGNLATVTCLMSREQNGPSIQQQFLIYPCTDGTLSHPSIEKFAEGYFLTKKIMEWFLDHYVPSEQMVRHPYVSPLLADDLSNLPDAWIATASFDPLRDEGKAYAERLASAGNKVKYEEYAGMIHGFALPRLSKTGLQIFEDIKTAIDCRIQQAK
jgi:acetyl esterase